MHEDSQPGHSSRTGADEALESLVKQFSDPLSFLRELVQNSLDASSTQVDVDFTFKAGGRTGQGLAAIRVADNGEGMDESIIDNHLLTLFSSTKEDDLTKIGKFGIGFVSIFAIEPQLVVLETARGGEAWRILFHPDGSFEKIRLDKPLEGTSVELIKPMNRSEFGELNQRGRQTVEYWCKYAECDIRVDGQSICQPFQLDLPLAVFHQEQGTELWVGLAPVRPGSLDNPVHREPTWFFDRFDSHVGFYNRGLTLVEEAGIPGERFNLDRPVYAGLSVLARSRYLEHTLTRDNVIHDENFHKLIGIVQRQINESLRPGFFSHLEKLARHHSGIPDSPDPGPPNIVECFLYARLPCINLSRYASNQQLIPVVEGNPLSLKQARAARQADGLWVATDSNPVTRQLAKQGLPVVRGYQTLVDYLEQVCELKTQDVNEAVVTALSVGITPDQEQLLSVLYDLLDRVSLKIDGVLLGSLRYNQSCIHDRLYLRQKEPFGLTRLGEDDRPTLLGGARILVLNRDHSLCRKCLQLSCHDLPLAALLLAQAIIALEGGDAQVAARLAAVTLAMETE